MMRANQTIQDKKTKLTPLEKHVGQRLYLRRTLLKIKQKDIAQALGVTFQQIQKYEKGTNRISSGTLFQLSQFLKTPLDFFFEGLDGEDASVALLTGFSESPQEVIEYGSQGQNDQNKEILALFSDFYQKADEDVRHDFRRIIEEKSLS